MKNARTTNSNASASYKLDYLIGELLKQKGSALAGFLVRLLVEDKPLTAWDSVETFPSPNINAAMRTLKNKYGWPIERVDFPSYKPDGCMVWFVGYKLSEVAIASARENPDLDTWIEMVKVAQARKREILEAKAAALDAYRSGTDPVLVQKVNQFMALLAVENK